LAVKLD